MTRERATSPGVSRPALFAACATAFTSTWTVINVGSFNLVDVLMVVALLIVMISGRTLVAPLWSLLPTVGVLLVLGFDSLARPFAFDSDSYTFVVKMVLGTTAPAFIVLNVVRDSAAGHALLRWFANGTTINSIVTMAVAFGYYTLPAGITARQTTGERLSGLAFHPNSLAFSLVITLPLYAYLATVAHSARGRVWWLLGLAAGVEGLVLADSRAGYVVGIAVAALALAAPFWRRGHQRGWVVIGGVATTLAFVYLLLPAIQTQTRFATESAVESSLGRTVAYDHALAIITDDPIFGGGLAAMTGVAVPLEALTIGGIAFASLYYGYLVGLSKPLFQSGGEGLLRYYGLLTVCAILGYGALSTGITERASYWVPLAFSALILSAKSHREQRTLPSGLMRSTTRP